MVGSVVVVGAGVVVGADVVVVFSQLRTVVGENTHIWHFISMLEPKNFNLFLDKILNTISSFGCFDVGDFFDQSMRKDIDQTTWKILLLFVSFQCKDHCDRNVQNCLLSVDDHFLDLHAS